MLHWHPGMSTGVPELDYQHKELIARFNDFSVCMSAGESEKRAQAGRILDFLQFYAQWHFRREEEFMRKYHCDAAEENRRAHAEFLERFGDFYEQWQTGGLDRALANDTFTTLMDWIFNHIQGVDARLNQFVTPP